MFLVEMYFQTALVYAYSQRYVKPGYGWAF